MTEESDHPNELGDRDSETPPHIPFSRRHPLLRDFRNAFIVYAWFVVVGKTIWRLDFAFINYDGPSSYLEFCSMIGWFVVMAVGMWPAAGVLAKVGNPKDWALRDYGATFGLAAMLVLLCMFGTMLVAMIGLAIGFISEDAANVFIKYTTMMRD